MADIDTSELMFDPDFVDEVGLINRASAANSKGRNELTETEPLMVLMSVQGPQAKDFVRYPDLINFESVISVWYCGSLMADGQGVYSDIILWRGKRYQVHKIDEDYMNFGGGFTKAFCTQESV